MIISSTKHGVDTIDQGVGDAPHKRIYSTNAQKFYRGCWFDPGMPALLCRAAYSVKWRWEMRNLHA
jgi:CelD/BcsL family acetyltransferase involved in cellulose biosynthesis